MNLQQIDFWISKLRGSHDHPADPAFNKRCFLALRAYHLALAPFADPANWSQDDWGILTFQGDEAALQAARDALEME